MKKLTILLLFLSSYIFSQENLYKKVKEQLTKEYPQLNLENKLLAINIWSVNDVTSRKANSELNKAVTTFGVAKLKGGLKGIVGVAICVDAGTGSAIILTKENLTKLNSLENTGLEITQPGNVIYDSEGKLIYKELLFTDIYNSVQTLITR